MVFISLIDVVLPVAQFFLDDALTGDNGSLSTVLSPAEVVMRCADAHGERVITFRHHRILAHPDSSLANRRHVVDRYSLPVLRSGENLFGSKRRQRYRSGLKTDIPEHAVVTIDAIICVARLL